MSRRAILADVTDLGVDPKAKITRVSKDGRLSVITTQPAKIDEMKIEVVVPANVPSEDVQQEQIAAHVTKNVADQQIESDAVEVKQEEPVAISVPTQVVKKRGRKKEELIVR